MQVSHEFFGSCYRKETLIRIPETGWGYPVDVFAIGCVACELLAGMPLIPWTDNVKGYLFYVERVIGRFGALQAQEISDVYPDIFRTKTRVPRVKVSGLQPKSRNRLNKHVSDTRWKRVSIIVFWLLKVNVDDE